VKKLFLKVKLWYGDAFSPGFEDSLDNWLYTHEKYTHPEIVLHDDNINLMALDGQNVWFSITPKEVSMVIVLSRMICTQ